MRLSKFLPLAAATVIAFSATLGLAQAERYIEKPPVMLSPGLTQPWILQLQGSHAGVKPQRKIIRQQATQRRGLFSKPRATQQVTLRAAQPVKPRKTVAKRGIDPQFLPTTVSYQTRHKPGSIVIDTGARHLYFILPNGKARRYGVGVGKAGFEWSGTERISRKAKWPGWTPPKSMIIRERKKGRELPAFMPGGPENPLGARALYLGSTLYRIHGTNQPWTIGKALSSGCIRMRNEDVTALYEQVRQGAKVVVL